MRNNRYGRIFHGDFAVVIVFSSDAERTQYAEEFETYHAGHEHDGEIPVFKEVNAFEVESWELKRTYEDYLNKKVTIDGYTLEEVKEYQNEDRLHSECIYKVPTCLFGPQIVVDNNFVNAEKLERHELSAIFGDMPDKDFKSLSQSIKDNGIKDNLIRVYEGKILDGWHRHAAAREWNLLRKLKYREWNMEKDGDPKEFVLAKNIERRHLTPGQRAQIAVTFNERFPHGGDRVSDKSKMPNGNLLSQKELAEQAKVGKRTIARAVEVEKAGESKAVISGEKSATDVLKEKAEAKLKADRIKAQDANVAMWKAFEKSDLPAYIDKNDFCKEVAKEYACPADIPDPMEMTNPGFWIVVFDGVKRALELESGFIERLLKGFLADNPDDIISVLEEGVTPEKDDAIQKTLEASVQERVAERSEESLKEFRSEMELEKVLDGDKIESICVVLKNKEPIPGKIFSFHTYQGEDAMNKTPNAISLDTIPIQMLTHLISIVKGADDGDDGYIRISEVKNTVQSILNDMKQGGNDE